MSPNPNRALSPAPAGDDVESCALPELRRRLQAQGLRAAAPDRNVDAALALLGSGRELVGARLIVHSDPGIGLPAYRLQLRGPHGAEVVAVSPGPRTFALLAANLGDDGMVETELMDLPAELAGLAAQACGPGRHRHGGGADAASTAEQERAFARIVCRANPATARDLLRETVDVMLEEADAERGIVALSDGGVLRPEIARLSGGRELPDRTSASASSSRSRRCRRSARRRSRRRWSARSTRSGCWWSIAAAHAGCGREREARSTRAVLEDAVDALARASRRRL